MTYLSLDRRMMTDTRHLPNGVYVYEPVLACDAFIVAVAAVAELANQPAVWRVMPFGIDYPFGAKWVCVEVPGDEP